MTEELKPSEMTDAQYAEYLNARGNELIDKMSEIFDGHELTTIALAIVCMLRANQELNHECMRLQLLSIKDRIKDVADTCQCANCKAQRAQA